MQSLIGTGVALATPFRKDFSIDTEALIRIVNFSIDGGVEYLVAMGTTAENATMSKDEKELVIDIYKSIFGITDDASIDLMTLDNSIEFLISNNKVQKVGMRKLIVKGVGNWFYRKFL